MYQTIVVALSFLLVVALLRLHWKVGRALMLSATLLAFILPARPAQLWDFLVLNWAGHSWHRTFPVQTVDLVLLVILVNFLGKVMCEFGLTSRLPAAMKRLLRSRRLALAGVPAIMGLMPTPGGIMLSAPIIKDAANEYGVPPARAAVINYWFRHVWEFSFPLFPALPLMAGIMGAEVGAIILHTCYISLLALLLGGLFLLRGFPVVTVAQNEKGPNLRSSIRDLLAAIWPVALALLLCTLMPIPAGMALAIALTVMVLSRRIGLACVIKMLRKSLEMDLILVVLAAMSYSAVLDASGAVGNISAFVVRFGLPVPVLVFLLPFMIGVITGISSAMVGLSFPLLMEFLAPGGQPQYHLVALAFYGGMSGVFVTPVHLCLALSKDYFAVKFSQLYRYILPVVIAVAVAVFGVTMLWDRFRPPASAASPPAIVAVDAGDGKTLAK
jgi:uncharacterized protein